MAGGDPGDRNAECGDSGAQRDAGPGTSFFKTTSRESQSDGVGTNSGSDEPVVDAMGAEESADARPKGTGKDERVEEGCVSAGRRVIHRRRDYGRWEKGLQLRDE